MKSSFIFYLLGIADVVILFYNLGQTFKWLTCTETNTPYILERREYYIYELLKAQASFSYLTQITGKPLFDIFIFFIFQIRIYWLDKNP